MLQQYRLSANPALTAYLSTLSERERSAALGVLDLVCEPLGAKELERALLPFYTRSKAREILKALKFIDVVALKPSKEQNIKPGWDR